VRVNLFYDPLRLSPRSSDCASIQGLSRTTLSSQAQIFSSGNSVVLRNLTAFLNAPHSIIVFLIFFQVYCTLQLVYSATCTRCFLQQTIHVSNVILTISYVLMDPCCYDEADTCYYHPILQKQKTKKNQQPNEHDWWGWIFL